MSKKITFNGESYIFDEPLMLSQLLEKHEIKGKGIAVALNEAVIPKGKWGEQAVQSGDSIEVITAIQGG